MGRRAFLTAGAALGLAQMVPFDAMAASGNYDAMLLACIDPRFPKLTIDHMRARSMVGKYSHLLSFRAEVGKRFPKLPVELGLMDLDGRVETFA